VSAVSLTIGVTGWTPVMHVATQWILNFTLSAPPSSDITLLLSLSGSSASDNALSAYAVTWTACAAPPPQIAVTVYASATPSVLVLNFTLQGVDVYNVVSPPSVVTKLVDAWPLTAAPLPALVYTGQTAVPFAISAAGTAGSPFTVTVVFTDSVSGATVLSLALVFPGGGGAASAAASFTAPSNTARWINISYTSSDASYLLPASPTLLSLTPYPPQHFGANLTQCACAPSGACSAGWTGTGACTCAAGFSGATCAACLPQRYGSSCLPCPACSNQSSVCDAGFSGGGTCLCALGWGGTLCSVCAANYFGFNCSACPACVYGTCSSGLSGSGVCVCQLGWAGALCDTPAAGALLPLNVAASGVQDTLLLFTLNATIAPFSVYIVSLPSQGTLFQTSNGRTPSAQLSVGALVTDALARVLYSPPPGAGTLSLTAAFDTFTYNGE
jgi:hypothetical protein